jgi:Spy/CpxP family protein refolding chaperone
MMFPMKSRMQGMLIAALLLAPLAAMAQDHAAQSAPPPPAPAISPAPEAPEDDDLAWFDDEMFEPGDGVHAMHGHGGPGGERMGMLHLRLGSRLAELDLSDAQREKLRDVHDAQARKAIQRRADMQLARMDLHKLMSAEKVDAGAVNAQIDRMARMHADAMKAAFEAHQQVRAVLTPEQFKMLRSGPGPRMERRLRDGEPPTPRR